MKHQHLLAHVVAQCEGFGSRAARRAPELTKKRKSRTTLELQRTGTRDPKRCKNTAEHAGMPAFDCLGYSDQTNTMHVPLLHRDDHCSYELQRSHYPWMVCRHQLLLWLWLSCSAFTWPGSVPHLSYQATHGSADERVESLRLLEEYPSQASRDACLAGLEDGSSEVRVQAARCVGAGAENRGVTNLLDLASAKDPEERAAALEALGQLGPARALTSIEQALGDPQPTVRVAATRALSAFVRDGSFDRTKLASLASSDLSAVRVAAIELVGQLPQAAAATLGVQLSAAAKDRAPEVRASALRAIGRAHDAKLLPALTAGLSDADEMVRLSAIAGLGDSNLGAAVAPLRQLSAARTESTRAARTALAALARIDDPSALAAISAALTRSELTPHAVDALVARARRLNQPEIFRLSASALQRAIEGATHADGAIDAYARGVVELAPFCEVHAAVASLTRALQAGHGEVYSLTRQLITLHAPQLMAAVLGRDAPRSARLPDAILAVLASSPDAPALLAAHSAQLRAIQEKTLQALLDPSLADGSLDARRALVQLWPEQPSLVGGTAQVQRLVRWLDDPDPQLRQRVSIALGQTADSAALEALAVRLEQGAPYPELTLQACAGAMLRSTTQPPPLRERLLRQFQAYLQQADEAVAMSALVALRASRDQRSAYWIAGLLRGTSPGLRAAAVQALGDFDQPEARRMLRDMLRGDNSQNASNAALALAELGSDRDVEALLRAAERGSWPLPPAAAYAAARITQRGVTRKHSLERSLCRFAQLRDSYVLSNIVSALATLGADACDEYVSPRSLLDETLPSPLRVAAAVWLQSTRPHTPQESAERAALLSRCANDHDVAVAAACEPRAALSENAGQTLVRVFETDGRTALRGRVVALRLPDASVFIGQSDVTGSILLPRAPAGTVRLEDPADQTALTLPTRVASAASP